MMIVGPVLTHQGGYAFDTWTETLGRRPGFAYRRIEDAYYARNSEIAVESRKGGIGAVICNTLADFVAEIADNNAAQNAGWAMAAE
ncbi:MAG TPA: hypothetical protein VM689_20515 [Aliidongia sp.]|nr:hypothetical protein [Aliidongia sp.]